MLLLATSLSASRPSLTRAAAPWDPIIRLPSNRLAPEPGEGGRQDGEEETGTKWALLVAGSSGYGNYRHQVPTVSYPRLVQLLRISSYSKYVLSGLVISTGGLQESLSKASVTALLEYLQVSEGDINEERNVRECMLSTDFLWILQQYQKCDRVVTPTFKTIEILFSKKVFLNMEDHTQEFYSGLLHSLSVELRASKDFAKLFAGLSILGYVASVTEPINSKALSQLLFFLGHRYPKIRKAAADQVYLVLLQNENLVPEDKIERALEVLTETCWEGALDEAKTGRCKLYEITGLDSGPSQQVRNRVPSKGDERKMTVTDENESYSSLVGFSGF
ncbi:Tubulin folding cofactor D C terminal [Musa troglodytarum]|uniref:Tubulin folding cofactor D C terminal n=1 Tax=Musa troglodytarum TaxID=320322 RepID=A0A9E7JGZ3_9LILI|nr:Tubulin folding cofactor D C terminal [Musa troglodytarum]